MLLCFKYESYNCIQNQRMWLNIQLLFNLYVIIHSVHHRFFFSSHVLFVISLVGAVLTIQPSKWHTLTQIYIFTVGYYTYTFPSLISLSVYFPHIKKQIIKKENKLPFYILHLSFLHFNSHLMEFSFDFDTFPSVVVFQNVNCS